MTLRAASFRGVKFPVKRAADEFGRRNVLHSYPDKDDSDGEDLGKAPRAFTVTAFYFGADGTDNAKALIAALETKGPGTLIHPWLGEQVVQLQGKAKVTWPEVEGGTVTIEMSFIAVGKTADFYGHAWDGGLTARDDPDSLLSSAADDAQDVVDDAFESNWPTDIAGYVDSATAAVTSVQKTIESYFSAYDRAVAQIDSVISSVQSLINLPSSILSKIKSRLATLMTTLSNPFTSSAYKTLSGSSALNSWSSSSLSSSSSSSTNSSNSTGVVGTSVVATTRPSWTVTTVNQSSGTFSAMPDSLAAYVRRTLIIEAARMLSTAEFVTKDDVQTARKSLVQSIAREMTTLPATMLPTWQALKVAIAKVVVSRTTSAADLETVTTQAVLPAVVLVYQINGNVDNLDDLVARNYVKHPGFVPAGTIEVLKDG